MTRIQRKDDMFQQDERLDNRVSDLELWRRNGGGGAGGGGGAPTGSAGGDLSGTYPNPQIAAGTIIDSDVAAANKDGTAATPSLRTLGVGAQQAMAGNMRLDQISAPQASVNFNAQKLTALADPTVPTDAATKQYVDSKTASGTAGGDLSGSYPNPQIAAGVIVDADVNSAAAIAESKLNLATDAAVGVGSRRTLGTGAQQAASGTDARFTDSRAPIGAAGGDLSGTYPNPQIAAGVITDADVSAANKDGTVSTPSMRTLGYGAQQALYGNVQLSSISTVNPSGSSLNMNNQRITALGDPSATTDAANKQYVDTLIQGLDAKASVKAASTVNVNVSSLLSNIFDGVILANNDRVLIKNQTAPAENGIYRFSAPDTLVRTIDADTWAELPSAFVFVEQGTTQADTGWVCTSDQGGTLGTTAVTWTQFSGAGQITAGYGLDKSGNTIFVGADPNGILDVQLDYITLLTGTGSQGIPGWAYRDASIDLAGTKVTGTVPVAKGGTGQTTAAAGGDLSGTYPNPQIAAGVIVDADVNAAAAITETKLNLATDAAVGVGSRRTLGVGAQQAAAGNDARLSDKRQITDAQAYAFNANHILHGGGTIIMSGGRLSWSARFIAISRGRGAGLAVSGYFDITMPPAGTVITGVGGHAGDTTTAAGIALSTWSALYYILPVGFGSSSLPASFRLMTYTADQVVPPEWVLIAFVNSDTPITTWVTPGIPIPQAGGTYVSGDPVRLLGITDTHVAAANKDGAAATPSMRTLGTSAAQALAGATRLDQIAIPTAPVNLNGQFLTNVATPAIGTDGANKNYVDNLITNGMFWRGNWSSGTTYKIGDAVAYVGRSWVCLAPSVGAGGQEPGGAFGNWAALSPPDRIPTGGTTGQALTKNSATNYDIGWSTVAGGGGGSTEVYIGDAQPSRTTELLWMDTDEAAPLTLNIAMDSWHYVGASGEPVFLNGYVNSPGGTPVGFRKDPEGRVHIKGIVRTGTNNTAVFTLPVGYRPPTARYYTCLGDAGAAGNFVFINAAGDVVATRSGVDIHFGDIEFDTESVLQTASVAAQPLDTWHTVGAAGEPAFQNSWSSVGGAYGPVAFRKDPFGHVSLKGVTSGGASNSVIFTLPAGFRPLVSGLQLPVTGDSGVVNGNVITINSDGTVTGQRAGTFLWLTNVEFDTETVSAYASGSIPACPSASIALNAGTLVNVAGAWTNIPIPAFNACDPAIAYTVSGGAVTVTDAGWYLVNASLFNNQSAQNSVYIAIDTDATPSDGTIANSQTRDTPGAYSRVGVGGAVKLGAGAKVYIHSYSPNTSPVNVQLMNFSIVKVG